MKLLSRIYNSTLRPLLPRRLKLYNGMGAFSNHRLLDIGYIPSDPGYEAPLCDGIRRHISQGDDVTIIGGGHGVSSLLSLEHSYPDGDVTTIEASEEQAKVISKTIEYAGWNERSTVHHAAVGEIKNAYGELGNPESIKPDEIPDCNVLVMDCEGAERQVLQELDITPHTVIVETHGCFGSPTKEAEQKLSEAGYQTNINGWEDKSKDVAILIADQRD